MNEILATRIASSKDVVKQFVKCVHLGLTCVEELQSVALVGIATGTVGALLEYHFKYRTLAELAIIVELETIGPLITVMQRIAIIIVILERINIAQIRHLIGRSLIFACSTFLYQAFGFKPQLLAQGFPLVIASAPLQHLCKGHGLSLNHILTKFYNLVPLVRGHTVLCLIQQHLHEQAYGSTCGGLAQFRGACVAGFQHDSSLTQVFLYVSITFFYRATWHYQSFYGFILRTDGHTAERFYEVEIIEGTQKLGLAIDVTYLLILAIRVGRNSYTVDVINNLVCAVYAFIVNIPTLQDPCVRRREDKVDELSHL